MKVTVYNQKGNKTRSEADLADNVFSSEIKEDLMAQAVYVYRSNQRLGTQKTKGISEVRGGGRKPWKQKTPDRARHGSIRSPIWVGGGHAHPINPRSWRLRLNKKMRRGALFSALSEKLQEESLIVVDELDIEEGSLTRQVDAVCKNLAEDKKLLIVTGDKKERLVLGARNIENVNVVMSGELNVYDVLDSEFVAVTKGAVEKMNEVWGKGIKPEEK